MIMKLQDYSINEKKRVLKNIADSVKSEYDFNDYLIDPERLKSMSELIYQIAEKYRIDEVNLMDFFVNLHEGKYGTLYKMPSDLIGKFNKFVNEKNTERQYQKLPPLTPLLPRL